MSDFEILSLVMMMLGIIVTLLTAFLKDRTKK